LFAEIIYTRAGGIMLKTPFVADFIDELKYTVPAKYRIWEPQKKVWLIDSYYVDEVRELVDEYFPDAETIDLARAAIARRTPGAPQWARTLFVQPNAPKAVIEAAYKALSKQYHPDLGGSEQLMKQLNNAIEQARG